MTTIAAVDRTEPLAVATGAARASWLGLDRRLLLPAQLLVALAAGLVAAETTEAGPTLTAGLLVATGLGALGAAHGSMRAGRLDLHGLGRAAAVTLLVATALVVVTDLGERLLWQVCVIVGASTGALVVVQLVVRLTPGPVRVLLVGTRSAVGPVVASWAVRRDLEVAGVLEAGTPDGAEPGEWPVPAATRVADVPDLVARCRVDAVVVLPGFEIGAVELQRLSWALEGSRVRLAIATGALESVAAHRLHLTRMRGTVLTCIEPSRPRVSVRLAKAVFDRVVGALILVAVGPLLLTLALLVRLDSPGPAIFRQVRVGRDGVPFTMLKLRTMRTDAEDLRAGLAGVDQGNGVLFKMHHDPRVTRVGGWLRSLSLDELPQLVNVVRGEMSLVGPRPALLEEVQAYDERARRRLAVLPGMTGLWQVRGRSALSWEESVALDLTYTDNITMTRDLAICVETIRAVASRKGAY